MNVLYVEHTAIVSGAQRSLLELLRALPPNVQATVACPPGEMAEAVARLGIPIVPLHGTEGSFKLHLLYTPRAVVELATMAVTVRRLVRRMHADIVHGNSVRAGLILSLTGRDARGTRPARIVHVRDSMPSGVFPAAIRGLLRRRMDAVVAVSEQTLDNFSAGHRSARMSVVPNAVDVERFSPDVLPRDAARERLDLDPAAPVLGIVAQLTPWKAQDDALRIIARVRRQHPGARLLVAGTAKFLARATRYDNRSFERHLHGMVTELRLQEAVTFLGERDDVPAVLRALDILLVPSWEEPFGRSIVEGMACGIPVVATDAGGPPEIVTDGVDGLLLSPREPARWAEVVCALLDDPARRAKLSAAARRTATARYDPRRHAAAMVALYHRVTT